MEPPVDDVDGVDPVTLAELGVVDEAFSVLEVVSAVELELSFRSAFPSDCPSLLLSAS